MRASSQLFLVQAVPAATPAAVGSGTRRVMAVLLVAGASNAATLELKNAETDTGTVLFSLAAVAGSSCFVDLSALGGLGFDVGCFAKPAGTGAVCYIWTT